jgi:hypothetical protein
MHQHLEECLVSDALSRCEFSGLGYIGFGQSQRNLDAGDLVQLTDKARTPRLPSLLPGSRRFLLYELTASSAKSKKSATPMKLAEAAALFQMDRKLGLPYNPAEDGFVLSITEIETYIRRHDRRKAARDSGFAYKDAAA